MIERESQKIVISNEPELLWALDQYEEWSIQKAKGTDSGIANMLSLLRVSVFSRKSPFRISLVARLVDELREAERAADLLNRDLSLSLRYIDNAIGRHSSSLDYDPVIIYAARFLFDFDLDPWKDSRNAFKVGGVRHKYLQSLDARALYYMSLVSGGFSRKSVDLQVLKNEAARPLLITGILRDYYNIPFYIGFHMQAFGEGATLAEAIYDYVFSERSRGYLSSLLPPDGPIEVDYSRNGWIWAPENKKWIGEDWEQPIKMDPRFRDMMLERIEDDRTA